MPYSSAPAQIRPQWSMIAHGKAGTDGHGFGRGGRRGSVPEKPVPSSVLLPGLFNQKLPNEVLGQLAGLAEELLIKVVTHCCDICQCFLLCVSQKRGCSTEAGHTERTHMTVGK